MIYWKILQLIKVNETPFSMETAEPWKSFTVMPAHATLLSFFGSQALPSWLPSRPRTPDGLRQDQVGTKERLKQGLRACKCLEH